MGRKGVSKRKPSKSKDKINSNKGENGAVPSVTRVSESPVARLIGKGDAITVDKGRKKK